MHIIYCQNTHTITILTHTHTHTLQNPHTPTHYKTHAHTLQNPHTHTLQNPHIHTPAHFKTHTYTHTHTLRNPHTRTHYKTHTQFDHNLIRFDIETGTSGCNTVDLSWKRYHIKTEDWGKFGNKLASNLLAGFGCVNNTGDHTKCDVVLGEKFFQSTDTEELVEIYFDYNSNLRRNLQTIKSQVSR
jgi:hypothetical protein